MTDVRDYRPEASTNINYDVVTTECICGCQAFRVVVVFDPETHEIAGWYLDMECVKCSARYKAPTPLDKE